MNENDESIKSSKNLDARSGYERMVREEWTASSTVDAWRKWSEKLAVHTQPLTQAILDFAELKPGMTVLDLASGAGEPALSVAKCVAPTGHVTATDLSPQMLQIAEHNARQVGLNNMSFQQADAHHLPFADESFDRVTCRIGVMYFWDCQRALEEIRRVLKPDGIAVLVAWGPIEQSQFTTALLGPFMKRKEMPEPPPDAPQPMRFAAPGSLSSALSQAGFRSVSEETRVKEMAWPGTPEELFQHVYEVAVPLQPYIDSFSTEDREAAIGEVIAEYTKNWDGKYTRAQGAINVVSGMR